MVSSAFFTARPRTLLSLPVCEKGCVAAASIVMLSPRPVLAVQMSMKKPPPQPDARAKRLAEALKANLARRKAAKKPSKSG